jgi:ferredoxin
MSYFINTDCISCSACEPVCPNQAISEGTNIFVIDPAKCTECVGSFKSSQCAEVCPVEACHTDPGHAETKENLLSKWRGLHSGQTPASGTY